MSIRMHSSGLIKQIWDGASDQLPRVRSGELKKLDRIVEDGEEDDDDDVAKTITNTALKYRIYAGFISPFWCKGKIHY